MFRKSSINSKLRGETWRALEQLYKQGDDLVEFHSFFAVRFLPFQVHVLNISVLMQCLSIVGKCRAIGVSNYTEKHLEELITSCEIKPMVNQVEVHPWLAQRQLRSVCNLHGVVVQAYSPLGVGSVRPFFLKP